jgi:hypothetical protein
VHWNNAGRTADHGRPHPEGDVPERRSEPLRWLRQGGGIFLCTFGFLTASIRSGRGAALFYQGVFTNHRVAENLGTGYVGSGVTNNLHFECSFCDVLIRFVKDINIYGSRPNNYGPLSIIS